jgi:signal transduction histidine kinase
MPPRGEGLDGRPSAGRGESGIITVFYDSEKDEISVLSRGGETESADIAGAVREIAASAESSGRVSGYLYFRDGSGPSFKIALAPASYLRARVLRIVLMLALAYIAAMALVYLISRRLSKIAARPMESAIDMERQFVADISHDLKTPITVVLANSSILRSNPEASAAEREQWLESTESAARGMMGLVNEMLTLSSLESAGRSVEKRPVDLSSAAEKAALQLEPLAYERGITLETDIEEGVFVPASPEYAERICSSLIENAIKYESAGGLVRVSLGAEKKKAELSVQNTGSVIAPEDLEHIFERFYRGDTSRGSEQGHGLGLPIVKQMTELLGAQISVKSGAGSGTVFTVTFDTAE